MYFDKLHTHVSHLFNKITKVQGVLISFVLAPKNQVGFFELLGHPIMETFHPFGLASSAFLAFRQMVVLYK